MRFVPHPYQAFCIDQLLVRPRLGLFLEMGLGKTVITLTALSVLKYDRLSVSKALVIAPKEVAKATWTCECEKWDHLSHIRVSIVMGTAKQRLRALAQDADLYVINRDNVSWLCSLMGHAWPFDMVICDEFSSFKSRTAKRWKDLKRQLPRINKLVGLTGTPAPNGLEDLWTQVYLLDEGQRLGRTWTEYRDRFFNYNPYNHDLTQKLGAKESVWTLIGDICLSMRTDDYLTLPPIVINDIPVRLSAVAEKAYKQLEKEYLLTIDEAQIEVGSALTLTGKLLQLCSGCVYDTATGSAYKVHDDKLDRYTELIEGLNGQHCLVFYGFRHEVDRLITASGRGGAKRIRLLKSPADVDAWNRGEIDVLLAHPASCAYGLNLQAGGHHIVWYTLPWSLELYLQANARLRRQGQKERVFVHRLLVSGGTDCDVAAALEGKRDIQDALMDALKVRIRSVASGS